MREFTDERFENLVITNDGSTLFQVQELNPGGMFEPVDEFRAVEVQGQDTVSEQFAQRRAQIYFDRMAVSGEPGAEGGVATAPSAPAQPRSRLDWQPKPVKPRGVNPLAGMREMTPQDVETVMAGARAEQDPAKSRSLRQQALSMMAQESKRRGESRAQCWVRHLLGS